MYALKNRSIVSSGACIQKYVHFRALFKTNIANVVNNYQFI